MAALEPSQVRRQDLEQRDTWQPQSPPEQGGRIRSHRTCGSAGALPIREAGSGAVGHVVVRLPCLGIKPVCGGTWSIGFRQWPPGPPRRGNETASGANISFPHPTFLRFYFNNNISWSLAAQGPKKISVEKISCS
jgi:hypothetical protein